MDYITVGKILKPQGLKGELKIMPFTDDPGRFKLLKIIYIDDAPYKIQSVRADSFVYLTLIGISDREGAEKFSGKEVRIDRVNAMPPEEDAYYICDLIGCDVFLSDGEKVGMLENVLQHGAADVFECRTDAGKLVSFPFLKKLDLKFDSDARTVTINKQVFSGVAVYED